MRILDTIDEAFENCFAVERGNTYKFMGQYLTRLEFWLARIIYKHSTITVTGLQNKAGVHRKIKIQSLIHNGHTRAEVDAALAKLQSLGICTIKEDIIKANEH